MKNPVQNDWQDFFATEIKQPYFQTIKQKLLTEIQNQHIIYPHPKNMFKAFELCSLADTKVIILGQDPYHGPNQAMGLSFSVPRDEKVPPSLRNIYQELQQNFPDFKPPHHGDLTAWATQGVLLLNAGLSVRKQSPNSHKDFGWHTFTDTVIKHISDQKQGVVFLLWGAFAQSKKSLIDASKHCILTAAHPSPFSAHKGFFGCQHFLKTNEYLKNQGKPQIDWTNIQ
ncbi:uracil-DNA glycosylase [bacterium DOLZORAL124_38_8]|nr:MAG: uracil-DNA glycosylase [bacterium DOLZORAL124_38_8]